MNIKYLFVGLLVVGALSGCSKTTYVTNSDKEFIKDTSEYYTEECIGGVVYYEGYKALAPAFNVDSTVKTCGGGL